MPPTPPEEAERGSTPRIVTVLLLILLIGLPVLVASSLFVRSGPMRVVDAAQPGGVIRGRVVDPEGRPVAGANVMLWLASVDKGGSSTTATMAEIPPAISGADGSFEFQAPAFDGHYQVVAQSDLWIGARESLTLVDSDGEALEPGETVLTVEPGCLLRIELVDSTGAALGNGDYTLSGEVETGLLFGLLGGTRSSSGSIHGGLLEIGGLPPMEATIAIEMDDGRTAELVLPLAPGIVRDRIEL